METIDIGKIEFSSEQKARFEEMEIAVIYLFGSYAEGKSHPLSDVDFGVVFEQPEQYENGTMDIYQELYEIFSDVLSKEYLERRFELKEHEFDVVFLQFAPPDLQFKAINGSQVLYCSNPEKMAEYEEQAAKNYLLNFKLIQEEFNKSMLNYYASAAE